MSWILVAFSGRQTAVCSQKGLRLAATLPIPAVAVGCSGVKMACSREEQGFKPSSAAGVWLDLRAAPLLSAGIG